MTLVMRFCRERWPSVCLCVIVHFNYVLFSCVIKRESERDDLW